MPRSNAPASNERRPSYQPFQCLICQSRFTRHENLKRHATLHSRSPDVASLSCEFCHATFSRPDLRHRHMKRKHPEHQENGNRKKRPRNSQTPVPRDDGETSSQRAETPAGSLQDTQSDLSPPQQSDDDSEPSIEDRTWQATMHQLGQLQQNQCAKNMSFAPLTPTMVSESTEFCHIVQDASDIEPNILLEASSFLDATNQFNPQMHSVAIPQTAALNTNPLRFHFDQDISDVLSSIDLPQNQEDWFPSSSQIARGCQLYFTHVSPFLPFLHQSTFDATQASSHLLLSILSLGFQYEDDPNASEQLGLGTSLSLRCFNRARVLVACDEERVNDSVQNLAVVQTYLLLEVYAMMYLCGSGSAYGLKTHSKMVSLARAGGLMQPIVNKSAATKDLDALWREFIRAESCKRLAFAMHQIDALWYQFLSIPRLLSHLEIKHDLPCPEEYWVASSSVEWAHRQLVVRNSNTGMQYSDAVRQFLSSSVDLSSIPTFDPYGAISITHFLLSSSREISGWSTMTGILSMERLEPLKSSLIALSPFIRSQPGRPDAQHGALCEATWQTAMIEVQIWSPSHTGGIVGESMDAVLRQTTDVPPAREFLCEPQTAKTVQPHIDWFLQYLDVTPIPDSEAPWVTLYAYKAFIIAWQLVQGGVSGAMQVIGVSDGDVAGAMAWARKVFGRRLRWQLGKIIMACLETLE